MHGYTDIHSHILPGIDDGSADLETTLNMVSTAYQQGVRKMIATPHYYPGHQNAPGSYIEKVYEHVKAAIREIYIDFDLYLGNEIYYKDEIIEKLNHKEINTLADTRYILLEFPVTADYRYLYDAVHKCTNNGYYPILAHIERYQCLWKKENQIHELIKAGAYIQINAECFKKGLINPERSYCLKLIHNGLVHFIGSDCHNMEERKPNYGEAVDYLRKKINPAVLERLIKDNPQRFLENKCI